MKLVMMALFVAGLASVGFSSFAHANGSDSLCGKNPSAPMCQPFPGK